MSNSYDKHYQKQHYFGETYPELLKYFKTLDKSLRVIDLGCGQGRDVISLGKLGFNVVGVDTSQVGIKQLNSSANAQNLNVKGMVLDFTKLTTLGEYDIIIMNSIFHFYKNDVDAEINLLNTIVTTMKVGAQLIIFMQSNKSRNSYLKQQLTNHNMKIIIDKTIVYREFNSLFLMVVCQK